MRVLITGATGFLGEHLARRLLADGAYVRVLARSPDKASPLVEQGAELAYGDITDGAALGRALEGVMVVYHLAGKLFFPGVPEAEYWHVHVHGTHTLLEACRRCPTLQRFVHCSTTGVLGVTGNQPADENTAFQPTNAYERSKLQAELLVRDAAREAVPAVIVRPGLVYGPGDLHLLGLFQAIQRKLFRPIGRSAVWLHPIYIADMTEAFARCGQSALTAGECLHVAGSEPATLTTLAATIARALGVAPPRGTIPLRVAHAAAAVSDLLPQTLRRKAPLTRSRLDFLTHSRVYQVTKARDLLGFVAATPLPEGVAHTVTWYRQEGYLPLVGSPRRLASAVEK
jgi:nucleoside-diphosphate-sugar epimerase